MLARSIPEFVLDDRVSGDLFGRTETSERPLHQTSGCRSMASLAGHICAAADLHQIWLGGAVRYFLL